MKIETVIEPSGRKVRVRRVRRGVIASFAFPSTLAGPSLVIHTNDGKPPIVLDLDPRDAVEVAKRLGKAARKFLREREAAR